VKVRLWGTRGSLAQAGPETVRYGGNTSCVEVQGAHGTMLILDAGTGIRRLGTSIEPGTARVDVLLTHLHMDHIQGLGFFEPLYRPDLEVHIWGPASITLHMRERLARYLSPPLFPVRLRDLPCRLTLHDVPCGSFEIGDLAITADLVCHPGPTVGYRITEDSAAVAYLPDHEPALGVRDFPREPDWTSGVSLAAGVNLLIHDAQYSDAEYEEHVGWGHSSYSQALAFAALAGVERMVAFHHDPAHDDSTLDHLIDEAKETPDLPFEILPGIEGSRFHLGS
jgi:phosphoribosyl 1,2-cyclic phosphodiesterase